VVPVRLAPGRAVAEKARLEVNLRSPALSPSCHSPRPRWARASCLAVLCWLPLAAVTAPAQQNSPDLSQMSIEDLLNVEITSASKKQQKLSQTAAAVYVITTEDIARSGFSSIPEVLRLAPGVEVAQINSSIWAISIRGFNGEFSNKLLVMIDGRTIYSPNFSGVLWNAEDLPLDDVERIEVIRGPGAAVWGANAVNGVINIISKSAKDTQGGLISAEAGNYEQAGGVRYGTQWGGAAIRFSSKYAVRGTLDEDGAATSNYDRWDLQRAGFRADWPESSANNFTFEGDLYQSETGVNEDLSVLTPPYVSVANFPWYYSGGSIMARWQHLDAGGSQITGQVFYDRSHNGGTGAYGVTDNTLDFDFQQQVRLGGRHEIVWGLGARLVEEDTNPSSFLEWVPDNKDTRLVSGFVQDEIALVPRRLWLTVGSKLEHDTYTGLEVEPDVRLLWALHPRHIMWGAVSRSVRLPSSLEERVQSTIAVIPTPQGIADLLQSQGTTQFEAETALSYEAGYRVQATQHLYLDVTGFYTNYQRLLSGLVGNSSLIFNPPPPHLLTSVALGNDIEGHGTGTELEATYLILKSWQLKGSYSWLGQRTRPIPADPTATAAYPDGANPEHQFQVHSSFDLRHNVQFDTSAYYVSSLSLPIIGAGNPPPQKVPRYTRLDGRLAWSPLERVELSVGAQNLLRPRQLEFLDVDFPVAAGQVRRSYYGKVEWRF